MDLEELIKDCERRLSNPGITLHTKLREESILRELQGKRQLLKLITDEMLPHECCGKCKDLGKLAWNEGEE